jgi:flagellar motor protein MotB
MPLKNDHSRSMTDLMAGLAAIFLLLAVIFLLDAQQKSRALEDEVRNARAAKVACDGKISELGRFRSSILEAIEKLRLRLESDPELVSLVSIDKGALERDPFVLPVYFNQSQLAFRSGDCTLPPPLVASLRLRTPLLVRGICEEIDDLRRAAGGDRVEVTITLEGHTDQEPYLPGKPGCGVDYTPCAATPTAPECQQLGFENNVRLSGARAQSVFFEMQRSVGGNQKLSECLEKYFVVSGRGPVEPIDGGQWRDSRSPQVDELNRRVLIKIRPQAALDSLPGGLDDGGTQ